MNTHKKSHRKLTGTLLLAGASWVHVASAQQTAASASRTANVAAHGATVEEVIVTAARRSQSAQKLGVPIATLSAAQLQAAGVVQPADLAKTVPGLAISPSASATLIYIRGAGNFSVTSYSDSSVVTSLDGESFPFSSEIQGNFFDLQRVEVLKGPQGTLYGRNATAGAVNLITNHPDSRLGGDFSVEVGDYGLIKTNGAVNVPVNDKISVRAAGQIVSRDGYLSDGYDDDHEESARLQTLIKPNDDLSILLGADYEHIHSQGDGSVGYAGHGQFADPNNPYLGPSTPVGNKFLGIYNSVPFLGPLPLIDASGHSRTTNFGIHTEINWNLGFATLTILPTYRNVDIDDRQFIGFLAQTIGSEHHVSTEVRLTSRPDNALKWIVGGYYIDDHDRVFESAYQGPPATVFLFPDETDTARSGFVDVTYSVFDHFRIVGGLRYTDESRTQAGAVQFTGTNNDRPFDIAGKASFTNLSYRIGAEYDVAPASLLYATLSTGYRAGGFDPGPVPNVYAPEKITAYTIGSKNRFLAGRLQANLELYDWDFHNHQEIILGQLSPLPGTTQPSATTLITKNIQKATDKGFDIDLSYRPTPDDVFTGAAEFVQATYDQFTYVKPLISQLVRGTTSCAIKPLVSNFRSFTGTTMIDCSGKPFTRSPKWSINLGYRHTFELPNGGDVIASVTTQLLTSSYIATDYVASEYQGAYSVTDLNLTYDTPNGKYAVTGYIHNVEGSAVIDGGFEHPFLTHDIAYVTLHAPRTFGAIFRARF